MAISPASLPSGRICTSRCVPPCPGRQVGRDPCPFLDAGQDYKGCHLRLPERGRQQKPQFCGYANQDRSRRCAGMNANRTKPTNSRAT
jgi:hypothetical protein